MIEDPHILADAAARAVLEEVARTGVFGLEQVRAAILGVVLAHPPAPPITLNGGAVRTAQGAPVTAADLAEGEALTVELIDEAVTWMREHALKPVAGPDGGRYYIGHTMIAQKDCPRHQLEDCSLHALSPEEEEANARRDPRHDYPFI